MNLTREDWERLDAYIEGTLSPEEEKKLREDPLFAKKLEVFKETISLVQERALTQKMQEWHDEIPGKKRNNPIWKWYLYTAAASILALMIVGVWKWTVTGPTKLYREYYHPDPGLPTVMSATENYQFDEAMIAYKTGNYQEALKKWEELYVTNPQSDTLNYFIGNTLLALGKPLEAQPYFERATHREDSYFLRDAYWYWGLALLKEGHTEEAKEKIEQSDHSKKEALLKQIE